MNIAIGMIFFGDRQSPLQATAIGLAVVAIIIQAIGLGGVPIIALGLAITFAGYAYIRKTVKASSAIGLFVETLLIAPAALVYLGYTFVRDGGIGPHADPATMGLLLLTGPVTTLTLLLFAFAVRRIRLTTTGMLQYLSPSISFILAITVFGEHLNPIRLWSFVLIWVCLVIFSADSLRRRRAPLPEEPV
jgi:chloramphenicol-sensitive protein RarD